MIDAKAKKVAHQLGIETYSDSEEYASRVTFEL
jgi:hypothetical protein